MDFKEMMEKEKEAKQKQNGKKDKNGFRPNLNWLFLLIFVVLIAMNYMDDGEKQRQIPYSQFEQLVSRNVLLNVTINTDANTAKAEIKPDSVAKVLGKNAVEKGRIEKERYEAYKDIYEVLKENNSRRRRVK